MTLTTPSTLFTNTFAQTNLSLSLFACDKAADHTFLFARQQELTCWQNASAIKVNHLKSMNKSNVLDVTIPIEMRFTSNWGDRS